MSMEQVTNNPVTNNLGAGVTESDLAEAIEHSGYPLQTVIANSLRDSFTVQDEWGYLDPDTRELRTVDIFAEKNLYDFRKEHPRVRPILNLLVECKQSEMPYVFFLLPSEPWLGEFPIIAGLGRNDVEIATDDSRSTWVLSVLQALELDKHPFLLQPKYCHTLSKCIRKGKDLELSGAESYNSLILPVLKSLLHFKVTEKPPDTAVYFDGHLAVGIGVLNAPMVGVLVSDKSNHLALIPWVRVIRHEYFEDADWWQSSKLMAVDVVHKDFFQQYLQKHVLPFASHFAALTIKHQQLLATGKGFAVGMEENGTRNIESRLHTKTHEENHNSNK